MIKNKFTRWIYRILLKVIYGRKERIFCISFQRTGTTSTGQFFRDHGYKVAGYRISADNHWSLYRFSGDYEKIFNNSDFIKNQVFEDNPWWNTDFYKYLFHRFPNSKFVLFERNSDKWFDSMMAHSHNKTLGNTYRHTQIYRREKEYYALENQNEKYSHVIDNLLPLTEEYRQHYIELYDLRHRQIREFFDHFAPERLIICQLEDKDKWKKLGAFFNIKVADDYSTHQNKS